MAGPITEPESGGQGVDGTAPAFSLAERLELGEVVFYPRCPFLLPAGEDRSFLLAQKLGRSHKNISYDPTRDRASGFSRESPQQAERLRQMLQQFSRAVTDWLSVQIPNYARSWRLDQVSFRPLEEATRQLRTTARNDLLHIDAFPSRPTNGHRILRVFANVNMNEPRVWMTSDPFSRILSRYGHQVGLPKAGGINLKERVRESVLHVFRPGRRRPSEYDRFMLRLHHFLKMNDDFQEHCPKRFWHFPPESAWMVMTDTATHAALRGRYALEHSFFIAPESLALPAESPPALLGKACGLSVLNRAA
jgi:hypothetical protein